MGAIATGMIRMDHSHVFTLLHRYKPDSRPATKRALVSNACLALEMHTRLEEETFYPALREAGIDTELLDKSVPEHDEIRQFIARLRLMSPEQPEYDETFMALMRAVLHHVAEEETHLLFDAERRLGEQKLRELGQKMARRRLALSREYGVRIARERPMAAGATLLAGGGALAAGAYALSRLRGRSNGASPRRH